MIHSSDLMAGCVLWCSIWRLYPRLSVPGVTAKTGAITVLYGWQGTAKWRRLMRDLSRLQKFAKRFRLENDRPAILEFKNALTLPVAKTAVDLLARSARHFGQFSLRQRKLHRAPALRLIGEQYLGEPHRQIEERNIGHPLVRTADPRTKDFHELHADRRVFFEKRQHIPARQDHKLTIRERHRIGRARSAVKKSDLAE